MKTRKIGTLGRSFVLALLGSIASGCASSSSDSALSASVAVVDQVTYFTAQQSLGADIAGSPVSRLAQMSFTTSTGPMSATMFGTRASDGTPAGVLEIAWLAPSMNVPNFQVGFDGKGRALNVVDRANGDMLSFASDGSNVVFSLYGTGATPMLSVCETVNGTAPVVAIASTQPGCTSLAPRTTSISPATPVAVSDEAASLGTQAYIAQQHRGLSASLTAAGVRTASVLRETANPVAGIGVNNPRLTDMLAALSQDGAQKGQWLIELQELFTAYAAQYQVLVQQAASHGQPVQTVVSGGQTYPIP